MSYSRFMRGSALLESNATTPGAHLTEKEKKIYLQVLDICRKFGLNFYDTIIQKVRYDEMSEIAAYGGFLHRYPHWYWGMQYEELQRGYEYNQHKIYELVRNCLHPKTSVLTTRGTILACDVKVGDYVVVGDETRKVVEVVPQKASDTKVISISGYGLPLISTPNHKWRILTQSGLKWCKVEDIKVGDIICAEDNYYGFRNKPYTINWSQDRCFEETRPNIRHCLKNINVPKVMTLELAELLGILIGDGSVGTSDNVMYVAVDKKLKNYAEHIAGLFKAVFSKDAVIYDKGNVYHVYLCSKFALYFLDDLGLETGITYENKRIPKSIWLSSQEYRAAFLRGLFDTDGYATDVLGVSGHNKELMKDVQLLLLEMGIYNKITFDVHNGFNEDGSERLINTIDIQGQVSLRKFNQRVGFCLKHKAAGLSKLINVRFCRGGGIAIPYLQDKLIEWGSRQGFTSKHSLARSVCAMRKNNFGFNALCSFIERASTLVGYEPIPSECFDLINSKVFYAIESVKAGPKVETIDIALDHAAHDFVAGGFLSHNTNPCVMYLLCSNSLSDNVCVVAHATGHNHFFKNNIFFTPTDENMANKLASNGDRIRKYMNRWGKEKVTAFIDHVLRIQTLIDPSKAWTQREIKEPIIKDHREYFYPRRLKVNEDRSHMNEWINPKEFIDAEYELIKEKELSRELGLFQNSDKDIFGFLKEFAKLKPWESDIMSMLYEESMYFAPQRSTKTLNEGFASWIDYEILARQGHVSLGQESHDMSIFEYAIHKMGVLGGKYSNNPYKTGFNLLLDIEERWNKGQFGTEWDECKNMKQREDWDTKAMLGKEKVFQVSKYYNDVTLINEFFTQEFCDKFEYFDYKHYPNGEWKIESRDAKKIKKKMLQRYVNGGLPDVRIVDPNHRNKNYLLLQHFPDAYDDRGLYEPYVRSVLTSIYFLWGKEVMLSTCKGNEHRVYVCVGTDPEKDVDVMSEAEYEKTW